MVLVKKFCIICNKEFKVNFARKNLAKFCSHKCYGQSFKGKKYHKTGELKNCKICNKEFYVFPYFKSQKFCSPNCYYKSKKGKVTWNKGKKMSESFMQKLHLRPQHFGRGHIPHNKGKAWSNEIKKKISETKRRLYQEGKIKSWSKGLTKETDKRINKYSERMKQVWANSKERERYSRGWFTRNDLRFKSDSRFLEGMKKAIELNRVRWKGNKLNLGREPSNKLTIPPKSELEEYYTVQYKDTREIAEIYFTNMNTVSDWLKYYNIEIRPSLYGYGQKVFCKKGHKVDSIGERKIADFLFDKGIYYLHNKVISKSIRKRYDFFLPELDIYIEYLGLKGKDFYDKKTEEKREIYKSLGLNVIWIIPGENIQKRLDFLNIRPPSEFSDRNIN